MRVYCGFDPRTSDLHLGHTVPMRKLRQFQELGHEVTFLIGTYTSLIGDPSDKDKLRPQLTPEEDRSATPAPMPSRLTKCWTASKTTDPLSTPNGSRSCTFAELIKLASNFTIQQFITRENFKLRWENGDAIYLHETFYAIMQGYDAYCAARRCPGGRHRPALQYRHRRSQADDLPGREAQYRASSWASCPAPMAR